MSEGERRRLLDDGLHLSAAGYDRLGDIVADGIAQQLC
jgi:lysophospholipase L1-like esterase